MENNTDIFTIAVTVKDKSQQVAVTTAETTDGVAYYKCHINDEEITQVRKDTGYWKQLWGDLNEIEVGSIGAAIDAYLEKNKIIS